MSRRGGTKKDLFGTIARLQEENTNLRNQKAMFLIAIRMALQNSVHDKNCWANQKHNPGPCTCHIADLDRAIKKVEEQGK